MPMERPKAIEAVVKVTERCNINCSYCYVFNKGDESYATHPPYMPQNVVEGLARFLAEGAQATRAEVVIVDFHGGEPLMMKRRRFDTMCETLRAAISSHVQLQFVIQTNAMLVDDEWIGIFDKHQIQVGVSIDGPPAVNDRHRVDHEGRGSSERVLIGLSKLQQARDEGLIPGLGILAVADADLDGAEIYQYIVHELEMSALDLLLPIDSHDDFDARKIDGFTRFLCDAFDEWIKDNDPEIRLRIFSQAFRFLLDGQKTAVEARAAREMQHKILTVASNGDLGADDSLRTIGLNLFNGHNVLTSSYTDFIGSREQRAIIEAENTLPSACQDCAWKNVCRGGAANGRLINRFSKARGFDNPSIMCAPLQQMYSRIAAHFLRQGYGFDRLKGSLLHDAAGFGRYQGACPFARGEPLSTLRENAISIPIVAVAGEVV